MYISIEFKVAKTKVIKVLQRVFNIKSNIFKVQKVPYYPAYNPMELFREKLAAGEFE